MYREVDPALGNATCTALRGQVEKRGLSIAPEPVWAEARFSEITDPFSQETSLVATWQGKARYGKATFFPDGRVFAEYQVLLPDPANAGRYIEAVQVWGKAGALHGDAVITACLMG